MQSYVINHPQGLDDEGEGDLKSQQKRWNNVQIKKC